MHSVTTSFKLSCHRKWVYLHSILEFFGMCLLPHFAALTSKKNLKMQCGVSLFSSWLGVVYSSSHDGITFPSTLLIQEIYSSQRWKVYDHRPHYQISILENVWCFWTCSDCRRLSEMDRAAIWLLSRSTGEDMRWDGYQNKHDWWAPLYIIFKTGSTFNSVFLLFNFCGIYFFSNRILVYDTSETVVTQSYLLSVLRVIV